MMYVSTWLAEHRDGVVSRLLCYMASSTYIIYLLHTTFEGVTKAVVHKITLLASSSDGVFFVVGALIVIVVGIVGPVLVHRYILSRFYITKVLFGLK